MMLLPVALEALEHVGFFAVEDLRGAKCGQGGRIALALEDRLDDPQAAHPVDLADDVVEPHIHQVERALHVLHVRGADAEMIFAQPVVTAQFGSPVHLPPLFPSASSADRLVGDETAAQQPVAVEHACHSGSWISLLRPGRLRACAPWKSVTSKPSASR